MTQQEIVLNGPCLRCGEVTQLTICTQCGTSTDLIDPLDQLTKDIRSAARILGPNEVRFLVDYYYQMQKNRIRSALQASKNIEGEEPGLVLDWVMDNSRNLEGNIRKVLGYYTDGNIVGNWSKSIVGIGPVIAAGLLAHIDITKAPTVGHIWRFAGLDPTQKWLGKEGAKEVMGLIKNIPEDDLLDRGEEEEDSDPYAFTEAELAEYLAIAAESSKQLELNTRQISAIARLSNRKFGNILRLARDKEGRVTSASMSAALAKRPWNSRLKTLCWKIGESFVKVSNHNDDVYGHIYAQRKELEIEQNESGAYGEQAGEKLATTNIGTGTDAYGHYSIGHLPPAHIHARAKRYAVKIFLSHWHHVAFQTANGGAPPVPPYVISHLGHVDYIAPPNWPME